MPSTRLATSLRCILLLVFVGGVVAFYAFGLHEYFAWTEIRANVDALNEFVQDNLVTSLVVFFLLYTAITAFSLPVSWILTLIAGALFGRILGVGVALSAATCGATLAFLSSRFLFHDWIQTKVGNYLDVLNRGIEKNGAFYLFSLRLVPFIPFWIINLGMGLTPIRTWTFMWISFVGMLPGCFLYVNAGTSLGSVQEPRDILTPGVIVSFVLLGVAPLLFRKLLSWRRTTTESQSQ